MNVCNEIYFIENKPNILKLVWILFIEIEMIEALAINP